MSDQDTPLHPDRPSDLQRQTHPLNTHDGERQQVRRPALSYIFLLLLGFLIIAILFGLVIMQFGLFHLR